MEPASSSLPVGGPPPATGNRTPSPPLDGSDVFTQLAVPSPTAEHGATATHLDLPAPRDVAIERVSTRASLALVLRNKEIVPELRITLKPREADLLVRIGFDDAITPFTLAAGVSRVVAASWKRVIPDLDRCGERLRKQLMDEGITPPRELTFLHRSVGKLRAVLLGREPSEFGTNCGLSVLSKDGVPIATAPPAISSAQSRAAQTFAAWSAAVTGATTSVPDRSRTLNAGRAIFEPYAEWLVALRYGMPVDAAARHVGHHLDTLLAWHRNGAPTQLILANPSVSTPHRSPPFESRVQNAEVAYLFGAMCAKITAPPQTATFVLTHHRRDALERLASTFRTVFVDTTANVSEVQGYEQPENARFELVVQSRQFKRAMNAHTAHLSSPPMHLLGTKQEKFAFLIGFTTFSGCMTKDRFVIQKGSNRPFLVQLGALFSEFDATPHLHSTPDSCALHFTDKLSLTALHEHTLVTDPHKRSEIESRLRRFSGPAGHSASDYHRAMTYLRERIGSPLSESSRALGIPPDTLRYWYLKGNRPVSVTKAEKWVKLAATGRPFDPETALEMYRVRGFPLQVSQEVAKLYDLQSIKAIFTIASTLGWDLRADPALILTVHDRFRWLLRDAGVAHAPPIDPQEVRRRISLAEWASNLGITAPSLPALRQAIVDYHLPDLRKIAGWCWKNLDLRNSSLEFEDVQSLLVIRAIQSLDRYDPARGIPFDKFAGSFAREYILTEYGKCTKRGTVVARIAREIRASSELKTVDSVMLKFRCTRETAVAALGFARAGGGPEVVIQPKEEDDSPIDLADEGVLQPDVKAEQSELFALVLKDASRRERKIIDLHYRQGLSYREIGTQLGTTEKEIESTLGAFLARVRDRYGSANDD